MKREEGKNPGSASKACSRCSNQRLHFLEMVQTDLVFEAMLVVGPWLSAPGHKETKQADPFGSFHLCKYINNFVPIRREDHENSLLLEPLASHLSGEDNNLR